MKKKIKSLYAVALFFAKRPDDSMIVQFGVPNVSSKNEAFGSAIQDEPCKKLMQDGYYLVGYTITDFKSFIL